MKYFQALMDSKINEPIGIMIIFHKVMSYFELKVIALLIFLSKVEPI